MTKVLSMLVNTIDKVKRFCTCNTCFDGDVYVSSTKYTVDGKSILGLFSLSLTFAVKVEISCDDASKIDKLLDDYKSNGLI